MRDNQGEDGPTEDELTEAHNVGQADRARYEAATQEDAVRTAMRQLITDDFYNPPGDPALREHYDKGFHNR